MPDFVPPGPESEIYLFDIPFGAIKLFFVRAHEQSYSDEGLFKEMQLKFGLTPYQYQDVKDCYKDKYEEWESNDFEDMYGPDSLFKLPHATAAQDLKKAQKAHEAALEAAAASANALSLAMAAADCYVNHDIRPDGAYMVVSSAMAASAAIPADETDIE